VKDTYGPDGPLVTTKKIRLFVQFFSGVKQWVPMEAARNDNPTPLVDYAYKKKLSRRPEWEWVKVYEPDELEDLRRAFIAKFENIPKYKFGVQIPTSISHALRLDMLNGNNLWAEVIQKEMDQLYGIRQLARVLPGGTGRDA
jgi:hypothetical protein